MTHGSEMGKRLRNLRCSKGLSKMQVAQILDKTIATISAYERGSVTPPISAIMKLATLYGVSSDELITGNARIVLDLHENIAQEHICHLTRINRQTIMLLKMGRRQK